MFFKDVIKLINITNTQNDIGDMVQIRVETEVFANKKSIRQSEFYQAAVTGLKPELMFEVRSIDYQKQQKLEHDNKEYNIIRTYTKNGEIVELVCGGMVV